MDAARLLGEIRRFDPNLGVERASMPPSSWYTEPAIADLERRAVFARTWQPVVRRDQVAEPGSFATGVLAGEPWVVARDAEGLLRGFHNVCRHKGREVVTGCGRADALVCGYHGWTYDLTGGLRSAPRLGGIRDFDRAAMALPALAVCSWGPWVFVNGDVSAAPLPAEVAAIDRRLTASDWESLRYVGRKSWLIACNWKVYVDNYLDGGYHIPHMHPSLAAQLDLASYRTELFPTSSIQSSGPRAGDGADGGPVANPGADVDPASRIGDGALYAWLYPNFMLNRYGPCLDSNYVIPVGVDRCEVVYEFYFAATDGVEAERFIAASMAQADVTQREDIEICESVQRGLGSRSYDAGRYAPAVEAGEYHFHRLLAAALDREVAAGQ